MTQSITRTSSGDILPAQVKKYLPYYVLALIVLCFYSNIYDNALFYDDEFIILKNQYLRSFHSLIDIFTSCAVCGALRHDALYRPLQNFLYLIAYQISGPTPFIYHLLNVLLHIANACLVYAVGCRLKFNPGAVFIAALLWALHPLHTEAITYTSATAEPLYSFFCLLGLFVLLPDFKPRQFLVATGCFVLGLLSKESAIIFPLLVMCSMYLTLQDRLAPKAYLRTWPLWLIAFLYLAMHFTFMPFDKTAFTHQAPALQMYASHLSWRIYTFLATMPAYVGMLIWPTGLHMDRSFPTYPTPWHWEVLLGGILVAAALAQILWGRGKRGLPLSWGFMWFASAHFTQSGILMPVNTLIAEHWMYLSTVGLFLGMAQTISTSLNNISVRKLLAACGCLIALIFGVLTYRQNEVWNNPITFYSNILDNGGILTRTHNNLGMAYIQAGEYDKALEQLRLAQETSHDTMAAVHLNIAAIYNRRPDAQAHTEGVITELKRALEIDPNFLDACDSLANVYEQAGDKKNADVYRLRAEEIRKRLGPPN